jgi:hypothetical protein
LALAGRDAGVRCSEIIGVSSRLAAIDFDLACAYRLLQYENQREMDRLKAFKVVMRSAVMEAVGVLFGGQELKDDDDENADLSDDDVL